MLFTVNFFFTVVKSDYLSVNESQMFAFKSSRDLNRVFNLFGAGLKGTVKSYKFKSASRLPKHLLGCPLDYILINTWPSIFEHVTQRI